MPTASGPQQVLRVQVLLLLYLHLKHLLLLLMHSAAPCNTLQHPMQLLLHVLHHLLLHMHLLMHPMHPCCSC